MVTLYKAHNYRIIALLRKKEKNMYIYIYKGAKGAKLPRAKFTILAHPLYQKHILLTLPKLPFNETAQGPAICSSFKNLAKTGELCA